MLPLWNVCAAVAVQRAWDGRGKSAGRRALLALALALLAAGAARSAVSAAAAAANYPGGSALRALHALRSDAAARALQQGRTLSVHVGVLPAQTGVSRFGELGAPWAYSKVLERGLRGA